MTFIKLTLTLLCSSMLFIRCTQQSEADLIVHNATIYTVNEEFETQQAMAIRGDSILEVGPEHQIMNKYRSKNTVDLGQSFVYPGLIDAHCHFVGLAKYQNTLNLWGLKDANELYDRVDQFVSKTNDEWIIGRGWDQNLWEDKAFPTRKLLDKNHTDKYIMLKRVDGHAALVNGKLLELAGITPETVIDGGEIIVKNGKCTGLLIDNAVDVVSKLVPDPSEEEYKTLLKEAEQRCLRKGLTMLSDAGLDHKDVAFLRKMSDDNELKVRLYLMLNPTEENFETYLKSGPVTTDRYSIRSFKIYADGALGSRGAHLLEPYSDLPDSSTGLILTPPVDIIEHAKKAKANGFQINTHAIGDGANRMILDLYADQLQGGNDLRWRIEHAQVVHPEDLIKFKQYNILPSVQPTHAVSDMPWAGDRLGEYRIDRAYAYQTLKNQNGLIALGTDFPVENVDPLKTILAAVHRVNSNGEPIGGYRPEEALTFEECIRGMTIWAAIANFSEESIGSLEAGKKADFVVFNRDLKNLSADNFADYHVRFNYIGGELVYKE